MSGQLITRPTIRAERERVEPTLLNFFEHVYRVEKSIGARSIDSYRAAIRRFDKWLGHPVLLTEINSHLVSSYLADCEQQTFRKPGKNGVYKTSKYSKATIRRWRVSILIPWKYAWEVGACPTFPYRVRSIEKVEPMPRALSTADMRKLIQAARSLPNGMVGQVDPIPANIYMPAFIQLICETGFRFGDVEELHVDDIDLEKRRVVRRQQKTGRPISRPITKALAAAIGRLITLRGIVCPDTADTPFKLPCSNRSTFYKWYDVIGEKAGVSVYKNKPHGCRRFCATRIYEEHGEAAARAAMGHRDPSMLAHYVDVGVIQQQYAVDDFEVETEGGDV